ncbi:MAG: hypothetical protein V4541_12330 [Bacteroidota bacterium]
MNPPKRRAKRIPNHPGNEDNIVHEDEKPFLNLVARLAVEVFFKELLDIEDEPFIRPKNRHSSRRNKNSF